MICLPICKALCSVSDFKSFIIPINISIPYCLPTKQNAKNSTNVVIDRINQFFFSSTICSQPLPVSARILRDKQAITGCLRNNNLDLIGSSHGPDSLGRLVKRTALCHQDVTSALSTPTAPCNYVTIGLVLKLYLLHSASLRLEAPHGPGQYKRCTSIRADICYPTSVKVFLEKQMPISFVRGNLMETC